MAKFDNAKVGDKVFSTVYGWGVIILLSQLDQEFPIIVEFDTGKRKNYRDDGKNFFQKNILIYIGMKLNYLLKKRIKSLLI